MAVFKIYYGAEKPMVAVGINQCRLLQFAEKYKGWHTIGKNKGDVKAIFRLAEKGYLEVSGDQFRFTYPRSK